MMKDRWKQQDLGMQPHDTKQLDREKTRENTTAGVIMVGVIMLKNLTNR